MLETLQMAVAGAALGLVFAVPFAILATDRLSPVSMAMISRADPSQKSCPKVFS